MSARLEHSRSNRERQSQHRDVIGWVLKAPVPATKLGQRPTLSKNGGQS